MKTWSQRGSYFALAGLIGLVLTASASAQVVVTVQGNTAYATISLTGSNGVTYDADATIVFDTPQHLTPRSLNLTAELIDPDEVNPRLPGGVVIDPAFPVMITVEPIDFPIVFLGSSHSGGGSSADLSFLNTYQIDVHTHDLVYEDGSPYRLYKAPIGQSFDDVTNDVMPGSVRVRGRGGAFSQFVVANDPRDSLLVSVDKLALLHLRVVAAVLSDGLRLQLLQLIVKIDSLLLIDLTGALSALDELIDVINENAGTGIANVWDAHHDVVNDAGEMDQDAYTLQFSMERALGGAANP